MSDDKRLVKRGLKSDPKHPWRYDNLGRLLLSCVVNWQDILVAGLQQKGFRRFRASHMSLLRHIDVEGTRISEIAQRARLTKQTVSQALTACEAENLVKTVPDPNDRRAKIVTFTNLGKAVIVTERDVMQRIDLELAAVLGDEDLGLLREALAVLAEWPGPFAARRRAGAARRARPPGNEPQRRARAGRG